MILVSVKPEAIGLMGEDSERAETPLLSGIPKRWHCCSGPALAEELKALALSVPQGAWGLPRVLSAGNRTGVPLPGAILLRRQKPALRQRRKAKASGGQPQFLPVDGHQHPGADVLALRGFRQGEHGRGGCDRDVREGEHVVVILASPEHWQLQRHIRAISGCAGEASGASVPAWQQDTASAAAGARLPPPAPHHECLTLFPPSAAAPFPH